MGPRYYDRTAHNLAFLQSSAAARTGERTIALRCRSVAVIISAMSEHDRQFLSVIRVWAALAWADGVIAEAEATAMKRLIAMANLTDQEREIALSWLKTKVELDTAQIAELSQQSRLGVYRAAAQLAAVDLDVAEQERSFLLRLRQGLQISDQQAQDIEAKIIGHRSGS